MRIAFSATYQRLAGDINQKAEGLVRLTEMSASGSRILNQADDPLAWSQAMDFRQSIRQIDAYKKNIDFAIGWDQATESALTQTSDLVVKAKNLAIQAISAQSPEKTQMQADALDQVIQQALTVANSQYDDRYLFGGREFTTTPYTIDVDPLPGGGEVVNYHGDEQSLEVRVGTGVLQPVNQNGLEVFGDNGGGILRQLLDLKDAVSAEDTSLISQRIGELDTSYQNLMHQTSIVGTRLEALDERNQMFDCIKIHEQSQLSDVADADMAEVITQLQQKQTIFEAVLKVTGMVANLNLTKYL